MGHTGDIRAGIVYVKVHEHLKSQRRQLYGISPI